MHPQLIISLLGSVILILLTLQNPNPVQVRLLGWESEPIPLIVIVIISFLGGIIVASILSLRRQRRMRLKISQLENELEDSKKPLLSMDTKLLTENKKPGKKIEDDDL
ncbi:MAG: LapA family protein [Candidatus Riflebacteria bacterium]|nr:LapA family protein [Candidatus Riflebacteria bacterium]